MQRTKFLQPITIEDPLIHKKIHHTYRLQYLKDVILGRALDDATFNVLNSCIIFNQIDIIGHIQAQERFLRELVSLFIQPNVGKGKEKADVNPVPSVEAMEIDKTASDGSPGRPLLNGATASTSDERHSPEPGPSPKPIPDIDTQRREIILLLQQLCQIGKNVQLPARITLFRTLVERGVLYAVQWALCHSESSDRQLVSTAGEILSVLLDHHTASVRNHILVQAVALGQPTGLKEDDDKSKRKPTVPEKPKENTNTPTPPFQETILQVLCRMLANSVDLALQCQLAEALRMLMDVPQIDNINDSHVGFANF